MKPGNLAFDRECPFLKLISCVQRLNMLEWIGKISAKLLNEFTDFSKASQIRDYIKQEDAMKATWM
jgi:hypothetical protein